MIIPAIVYKVIGFIDKNGIVHKKPIKDSNEMKVQLDNGVIATIYHHSGNKHYNSLSDYLENKANLSIKKDQLKEVSSDILIDRPDSLEPLFEKTVNAFKQHYPNLPNKEINKMAANKIAEKILYNRQLIQSGSIIRSAFSFKEDESISKASVKSIYLKYVEGKMTYDTSGIYAHALLPNHIPIELSIARDSQGNERDFYNITTSNLIKADHIFMLLDHMIRTIQKSIEKQTKVYLPYFFNVSRMPQFIQRMNDIQSINNKLEKDMVLNNEMKEEYINYVYMLKTEFQNNKKYFKYFKMSLPLSVEKEKHKKGLTTLSQNGGKSPVQQFRNAVVNINFSRESDYIKNEAKAFILNNFMKPMINGQYFPKLLMTYNIAGNAIIGEGTSWGFMHQNIDYSKATLSFNDSKYIIEETQKYVENLKKGNQNV